MQDVDSWVSSCPHLSTKSEAFLHLNFSSVSGCVGPSYQGINSGSLAPSLLAMTHVYSLWSPERTDMDLGGVSRCIFTKGRSFILFIQYPVGVVLVLLLVDYL